MKLYGGSFINSVYAESKNQKPEVGMGATILMYTDRHAATIVEVRCDGRTIVIKQDIATALHRGMTDAQSWSYKPNPNATPEVYTLRKNGNYVKAGDSMKNGTVVKIGKREEYYDYSF